MFPVNLIFMLFSSRLLSGQAPVFGYHASSLNLLVYMAVSVCVILTSHQTPDSLLVILSAISSATFRDWTFLKMVLVLLLQITIV